MLAGPSRFRQPSSQFIPCFTTIFVLRPMGLRPDNQPRWCMNQAHRRVGLVSVLPPSTAGPVGRFRYVFRIYVHRSRAMIHNSHSNGNSVAFTTLVVSLNSPYAGQFRRCPSAVCGHVCATDRFKIFRKPLAVKAPFRWTDLKIPSAFRSSNRSKGLVGRVLLNHVPSIHVETGTVKPESREIAPRTSASPRFLLECCIHDSALHKLDTGRTGRQNDACAFARMDH